MSTKYSLTQSQADLKQLIQTVKIEFPHLKENELNYKESAESWSILECLQHLNLYCDYYNPCLHKALSKSAKLSYKPIKLSWIAKKSINTVSPEDKKPKKTFKNMNPALSNLPKDVIEQFLKNHEELEQILQQAKNINTNKKLIPIEFMKWLKLSIAETLIFMGEHGKRHVNQALKVKNTLTESDKI